MKRALAVLALIATLAFGLAAEAKDKLEPKDLIARHLQSIAPADTLGSFKSRFAEGAVTYEIHTGGAGQLNGKVYLISEGQRLRFVMDYSDRHYGENFLFDGATVNVFNSPRSAFGQFVYDQSQILRDGLFGSVLSTAWPLYNLDAHEAKVSYNGLKKMDGRNLHELVYKARKGGGGDVRLYFDPETYRHVMSVYTSELQAPIGFSEVDSARQQVTRLRVEERFSNFQQVNGMTLPGSWNIHFSVDSARSTVMEWQIRLRHADDNVAINPQNFATN